MNSDFINPLSITEKLVNDDWPPLYGKFNEYVIQLSGEKLFYLPNEWDYKSLGDKKMGYVCLKDSYIPLKIRKFDSVWKYVEY